MLTVETIQESEESFDNDYQLGETVMKNSMQEITYHYESDDSGKVFVVMFLDGYPEAKQMLSEEDSLHFTKELSHVMATVEPDKRLDEVVRLIEKYTENGEWEDISLKKEEDIAGPMLVDVVNLLRPKERSLLLDSTSIRNTFSGVPLWLLRPKLQGRLTIAPF